MQLSRLRNNVTQRSVLHFSSDLLISFFLQVTWVEHVEADDTAVHRIYRLLVNSGLAFGAKRWLSTLDRQCERLASFMANSFPSGEINGTCCH